jgi:hypothetical protein
MDRKALARVNGVWPVASGDMRLKRVLLGTVCLLAACAAQAQDDTARFLKRHWAFPIPAQGAAPAPYSALEADLRPEACGACHPRQYDGWRDSRHARAMGPGVMGQLLEMKPDAVDDLRACTICHAPLAEQETSLRSELRGRQQTQPLHERGLMCADCHVRRNVRYGPPPMAQAAAASGAGAHGGFIGERAFEDGRFCAACHQFGKDGLVLNGKPLENTYAEWKASPFAARGMQCQGCHMPERQHLWRGIHDPDMSRKALTITTAAPVLHGGKLHAQITLVNTGAGHDFPTYVTPLVRVQIFQETADHRLIAGTLRERIIARRVSPDVSRELSDTRLAPGGQMSLDYAEPPDAHAAALVMRVRVEPDHFYAGLYRSLLDAQPESKGSRLIRDAEADAGGSAYDLYVTRFPPDRR